MARKLAGQASDGAATSDPAAPAGKAEVVSGKYKPYLGKDSLPPAKVAEKVREIIHADGSRTVQKELRCVKQGEPRYFVTVAGELIKVARKHCGIARSMVFRFKRKYETKDAAARRKLHMEKRAEMIACKIPGAEFIPSV